MRRIGLITLNGENYGNILQNYAVQETVAELGFYTETIKNTTRFGQYYPKTYKTNKFTPKYIKAYISDQLNYRYNIKNSGSGILKTLLFYQKNKKALNLARKARKNGFDEFRNELIHWSETNIDINKPWNKNQIDKYDYFVSGSDQVWNPTYPSTSSINFLQFAPKHKRVTFSPSFGVSEIPEFIKDNYSKWLNEIPYLSVREERGREIIKELCGREAVVLCDPTMCLTKEKWLSIAQKPDFDTSEPYILTYFLGDRTKKYDRYIDKIAKEYDLKIINLFDVLDLGYYATSPQEFIYLINNAKLVCTDSFHGTVFSIIMNTDFVTFPRVESGKSMNSRIETLLSSFNLQERNYNNLVLDKLFSTDFLNVDDILNKKRKEVFDFLQKAFNTAQEPLKSVIKTTVLDIKENCCGCNACLSVCPVNCISMKSDVEGFKYPEIDHSLCINCKKCEKVCPAANETSPEKSVGERCFVAYSLDSNIRKKSSSGGVFYHIAHRIIEEGGVVFGAAMVGRTVKHIYAKTEQELKKFMGSKYVQSEIGDCYIRAKEFLDLGKKVLFSGTPCQIKGLYAYLGEKEYPNLLTQDLICHGVPSPKVWESYVSYKSNSDMPDVSFRDKRFGWHYFSMRIRDGHKTYRKNLNDDWFLKLFLDNTILRPSCYNCQAKKQGNSADITIADCWSPRKVSDKIKDTDKGLSLVLINSKNGNDFWDKLSARSGVFFEEANREKALASQAAITQSAPCNPKRAMFFEALDKVGMEYLYKNWYKKSVIKKVKQKIIYLKMKMKIILVSVKG